MDFDLEMTACSTKADFSDTVVDRCLCLPDDEDEVEAYDDGDDEGSDDGHDFQTKRLYHELRLHIPREVRDRTSRYLLFLCYLRGITSTGTVAATESSAYASPSEALPVRAPLTILKQVPDMVQVYRAHPAAYVEIPSGDWELATELSGLKRQSVAQARRGL